jgi:hypothetical protein
MLYKKWRITFRLYATIFVRDKGIAKQFQRTKNVAEKKRTKGARPTAFFRSPSRESGEAHTDLLCVVQFCFILFQYFFILIYSIILLSL